LTQILNKAGRLETLKAHVASVFESIFGGRPAIFAAAPGRVNVIGEHIDYNGGLVLPAAIERWIVAAVRPRSDLKVVLYDVRFEELVCNPRRHPKARNLAIQPFVRLAPGLIPKC
jgi:galactokinase